MSEKFKPRIYKGACPDCGCWVVQVYENMTCSYSSWTWAVRSVTGWLPHPMYMQEAGGHKK